MFDLKVNDDNNSFMQILKEIKKKSKSNKIINKANRKLQVIKDNSYYQDVIAIRNRNTHSIRATQYGFLDRHDSKTGITYGTVNKPVKPDEIVMVILESIKLLGAYTVFMEEIIEEFYDCLFEEYKSYRKDLI